MKKNMKKLFILGMILTVSLNCGCSLGGGMKDGFYMAQMEEDSRGWTEYVSILVKNNKIVSAEFNARNQSGFIKAWDNEYMRSMRLKMPTYPNQYTRKYVEELIETQGKGEIDTVTGATSSGRNFKKLVEAAIKQAKKGDSNIVIVKAKEEEEKAD